MTSSSPTSSAKPSPTSPTGSASLTSRKPLWQLYLSSLGIPRPPADLKDQSERLTNMRKAGLRLRMLKMTMMILRTCLYGSRLRSRLRSCGKAWRAKRAELYPSTSYARPSCLGAKGIVGRVVLMIWNESAKRINKQAMIYLFVFFQKLASMSKRTVRAGELPFLFIDLRPQIYLTQISADYSYRSSSASSLTMTKLLHCDPSVT